MISRQRTVGFSLLEVLFASFLLITALSLTIFLIHQSFQSEADSGIKVRALHDAQNVIEEIRAIAKSDFKNNIGSVDGRVWPCTLSDYLIESSVKWEPLALPCTELESQYNPGVELPNLGRKILTNSVWKVDVEVRRKDGSRTLVHLTTLVTDLAPESFELRMLTPDGLKAPPQGELRFRAVAYDADQDVIEDLVITWYVEPINSFGSIHTVRRDGWECIYKNLYLDYGNRYETTPGQCRIVARGEYKGQVRYATTEITNE